MISRLRLALDAMQTNRDYLFFLRTLGIHMGSHDRETVCYLLAIGLIALLGSTTWTVLLGRKPNPRYYCCVYMHALCTESRSMSGWLPLLANGLSAAPLRRYVANPSLQHSSTPVVCFKHEEIAR